MRLGRSNLTQKEQKANNSKNKYNFSAANDVYMLTMKVTKALYIQCSYLIYSLEDQLITGLGKIYGYFKKLHCLIFHFRACKMYQETSLTDDSSVAGTLSCVFYLTVEKRD